MDSTLISTRPDEGTLSLSRARRAALGSFAGAVVDWYDFLLYGITAALVFNREFFPQVSRICHLWRRIPFPSARRCHFRSLWRPTGT